MTATFEEQRQPLLRDGSNASAKSQQGVQDVEKQAEPDNGQGAAGGIFGMSATSVIIVYYALCSSTMLVINKVTVHHVPAPSFVLFCQLLVSALCVKVGSAAGLLQADALEWSKVKRFMWVIVGFLGTIYANIKVLQYSNVETFITFRSSTPLVLSICDFLFLGRALPSCRSWFCLFVLLLGSVGYVFTDSGFDMHAYCWLLLWYAFFTFDTVYVKHMCESVKMTNWGRVYYTNLLALLPLGLALPSLKEHEILMTLEWTPTVVGPLVLSCMVGLCMSHAAYMLRDAVSATLFTIVGIVCKLLTVVINVMIWDKHASIEGIAFLMVCVLSGTFYEQAPKRALVGKGTK